MNEQWRHGALSTQRRALINGNGALEAPPAATHRIPTDVRRAVDVPPNMHQVDAYVQGARDLLHHEGAQSRAVRMELLGRIAEQLALAVDTCSRSVPPHPWKQPLESMTHWNRILGVLFCFMAWQTRAISTDEDVRATMCDGRDVTQALRRLTRGIWQFLRHVRFVKLPIRANDARPNDLTFNPAMASESSSPVTKATALYELPRHTRRMIWQCLCGLTFVQTRGAYETLCGQTLTAIERDAAELDANPGELSEYKARPYIQAELRVPLAPHTCSSLALLLPATELPLRFAHRTLGTLSVSDMSAIVCSYAEQWYRRRGHVHRVIAALWMRLAHCMHDDAAPLTDPFLVVDGEPTEYFYLEMERHIVRHTLLQRALDAWTRRARTTQTVSQLLTRGSVPEGVWDSTATCDVPAHLHLPPGFRDAFCTMLLRLSSAGNWYTILRDRVRDVIIEPALLPHETEKQHDVAPSLASQAKIVIHGARPKQFEYIAEVALDDRCLDRVVALSHGARLDLEDVSLSERDPATGLIAPKTSMAGASPETLELRRDFARRGLPVVVQEVVRLADPTCTDVLPRIHVGRGDASTQMLFDLCDDTNADDASPHIVECRGEYVVAMREHGAQGAYIMFTSCFVHALYVWHAAWAWRFGAPPSGKWIVEPFRQVMRAMIDMREQCTRACAEHDARVLE